MINSELQAVLNKLCAVASDLKTVEKLWVFGSRYKNTNHKESDLDIAIAIMPMPAEYKNLIGTEFNYWRRFESRNENKFKKVCPWVLDLQWYGGSEETPYMHRFLKECSLVIYEKY